MFGFFRRTEPAPALDLPQRWRPLPSILGTRWRLQRLLGESDGWAEWLALDEAGQQVLVSVWPEWNEPNPEGRQRMVREARACSMLRHPGIVPILGYAEQGEWFWWARPWLEGAKLSSLLGQPLEQALGWLRQLVKALAYAHGQHIVHQRLHPDCIWVDGERLSVSEFAFARLETRIVHAGPYQLGSPRFLAPEQITGMAVSPASNYFTLGSLAFEMLTGRPLFSGDDPIQVLVKVMSEELPAFEVLPELLPRLLDRNPELRLSDPAEVLSLLGQPSSAEMREVLADLQSEGTTVARDGVFTLDASKALEKLAAFRFPEAWDWLVSLCAAACALGARKLSLDWKAGRLTLNYAGLRLPLENFWLKVGYLGRGLASALTQHRGRFEVASDGWKLAGDRVSQERPSRALLAGDLQIRVDCPEPDWDLLRHRFFYSPLAICWNGRWQATSVPNRPAPLEGYSLRVDPLETSQWLAVVDGMTFALAPPLRDAGRVVLCGPLKLDAERRNLVEDEQLSRVLVQVRLGVERALEDFALAPDGLDTRSMRLYERAVAIWEAGQERGKIDRFALAFLALHDGETTPSNLARQCFERAAGWERRPENFWQLACHRGWFGLLRADWTRALEVSDRAFAREHARLHWLLQAWLEWGEVAPDVRELGSLLHRFPGQRLDARFDPLFVEKLPEDAPSVWLECLPKHWTQSRLRLRRRGADSSRQ